MQCGKGYSKACPMRTYFCWHALKLTFFLMSSMACSMANKRASVLAWAKQFACVCVQLQLPDEGFSKSAEELIQLSFRVPDLPTLSPRIVYLLTFQQDNRPNP
jgi:hypothetical protein